MGIFALTLSKRLLMKPITDQDTTCQMVQITIPSSIFDRKVVKNVRNMAEIGPRTSPQTIIDVTGCVLGRNEKVNLPAT